MNRLQIWNKNIVSPDLIYKFNSQNIHDIIYFENFVLKSCINTSVSESKDIIFGLISLELLTNQKARLLRTRKSIAAFKTRKFIPISSKTTIRKKNLYSYLDYFVCVVLPKLPQLKELEKGSLVHSRTSLSIGLTNLSIFPQLSKETEQLPKDMGITITINTSNVKSSSDLLIYLGEFQIPISVD